MSEWGKVTPAHLRRDAYVYVRQSSPTQVRDNTESLERQYELAERALVLGWSTHQVVVIDDDLGRSGAEATRREGFQRLVADVGLGRVGLVLGIEVSRLARNNSDWYHLLDLCALTDTLIADGDGLYHPADYNDRLVLGLKGTMSEAELHLLRHRLSAGARHKAAKGELHKGLPVGFDYDPDTGAVVMSADEAQCAAIATVFTRFEELGSARQVMLSLREDGLLLPRRPHRRGRVTWVPATYRVVYGMLTNPAYAGAFVFGRSRQGKRIGEDGRLVVHTRRVAREDWEVCIPDHHAGFVSWETYLANQERLRSNRPARGGEAGGAVREGEALLQGLLRCGRCGRRMYVVYESRPTRLPRYLCVKGHAVFASSRLCQSLGGRHLEGRVLKEVFEALEPAALAATADALTEAEAQHRRRLVAFETAVERARYEAERARRQFDACEPENRLVARTLERAWEERLVDLRRAEAEFAAQRARRPTALTAEELDWLNRAGADVRAVFEAPTTTPRERKQLLRALISEIVLTVESETRTAQLRIMWEGGATTELTMALHRAGWHPRATDEDTVDLVRRLAQHYHDRTIAIILSRQGRRTATGLRFTQAHVKSLRISRGILPYRPPTDTPTEDNAVVVSVREATKLLGVSSFTVYRWLREGFIVGEQLTPGAPWRIRVDDALRAKVLPDPPDGWLSLNEAAKALGVARQTVLHKVQRGELPAVHVNRGQRKGLRIQVQRDATGLFD